LSDRGDGEDKKRRFRTAWHEGTIVSEIIGSTGDRRLWADLMTNTRRHDIVRKDFHKLNAGFILALTRLELATSHFCGYHRHGEMWFFWPAS